MDIHVQVPLKLSAKNGKKAAIIGSAVAIFFFGVVGAASYL